MRRSKWYARAKFAPEVMQTAGDRVFAGVTAPENRVLATEKYFTVEVDSATWTHDSEAEFFADYRRGTGYAKYFKGVENRNLDVAIIEGSTVVSVQAESREIIQSAFEVFEAAVEASTRAAPPPEPAPKPRVFIGHGRSLQWRDLKDHLHEKHGYDVEAYEVGARSGHAVRDVLEEMLRKSAFALLVMTGEDITADGALRARQNVIHEVGLFQGRLGFSRAIVLLEEGTEEFSNIEGVDQIRFAKNRIREAFGDVLATIRREFGGAV